MENTSCSLKKTVKGGKQMIFKYLINSVNLQMGHRTPYQILTL